MNVIDILKQYADSPTDTNADFDAVARQVPPEVLGHGIAEALKSEETPSFGSMIGSLFGGSDPQQRAGLRRPQLHLFDVLMGHAATPGDAGPV